MNFRVWGKLIEWMEVSGSCKRRSRRRCQVSIIRPRQDFRRDVVEGCIRPSVEEVQCCCTQ
jgi:hypothetical protein